jgi:hypothetical protein
MASAAAASAAAVGGASYGLSAAAGSDGGAAAAAAQYEALIKARPEFAAMGKLFKSSAPVRWVGFRGDEDVQAMHCRWQGKVRWGVMRVRVCG